MYCGLCLVLKALTISVSAAKIRGRAKDLRFHILSTYSLILPDRTVH